MKEMWPFELLPHVLSDLHEAWQRFPGQGTKDFGDTVADYGDVWVRRAKTGFQFCCDYCNRGIAQVGKPPRSKNVADVLRQVAFRDDIRDHVRRCADAWARDRVIDFYMHKLDTERATIVRNWLDKQRPTTSPVRWGDRAAYHRLVDQIPIESSIDRWLTPFDPPWPVGSEQVVILEVLLFKLFDMLHDLVERMLERAAQLKQSWERHVPRLP